LAALAAVGQFAGSVYTPSIPSMAVELGQSVPAVQATYGVFVAAFAFSVLIWGPIADAAGRRKTAFAGLSIFLIGTLAATFAPDLGTLLLARVLQAVGAASGIIVSRAATRDSFEGADLTRVLAAVSIAFAIVPGVTPLLGGLIEMAASWRVSFALAFVAGAVLILAAHRRLPETLPEKVPINLAELSVSYRMILGDRGFVAYALSAALVFSSMGAFFAAGPQLYIGVLGITPAEFGLYPPLSVAGFIIGASLVRRLSDALAPARLASLGLAVMAFGVTIMAVFPLGGVAHKHLYTLGMVFVATGLGLFLPTAIAAALQRFPERAGTAASIQGCFQMLGASCGAFLTGAFQESAPTLALPLTMAAVLTGGVLVFALLVPRSPAAAS
ncbi:MAG: multidrug effflux MFS transporter, partial [Pseudomonadota bacterium]